MTKSESMLTRILNAAEEIAMASMLAIMTLITFVQVVLRYVFNSGWVWSLEATTYAFATMIMVGMAYGVRTKSHIAVDILGKRLSSRGRRYLALLASFFCLVYAALMLYGSAEFVARLYILGNMARDVAAPKWLLTLVMPLGFALLFFRLLEAAWHIFKGDADVALDKDQVT